VGLRWTRRKRWPCIVNPNRTPYLREVMDALSTSSPYERVVLMKGAQTGGSEAGLNWLGYIIQNAPGIAMLVMPSLDMVRRNTTVRIDPLIEAPPALRDLVSAPRSRDAGNSLFRKSFPGGQLVMTGANSAVGLRSTPVRYLFLDEVDGYPGDADGEGDSVDLAIQRTTTFRGRRKIYMVFTPTLKGHSRIEAAFLDSDQRYFHVPCKHCGDMAPITWARIRWPEGQRDAAYLICDACGGVHHEHDKPRLLAAGEWRPTALGDGRTAGFHLSSLCSPWETWAEIAQEHVFVRSDAELKRARAAAKGAGVRAVELSEKVEVEDGAVAISTMHFAKGLEFRSVVVMACDDEVIPQSERIESVADDADLEEVYNTERHLLYVACTRARDHLLVTGVTPVSEFVDDFLKGN
jgi:phage terminase large subunit GpA-like protein